ncbi:hypothetical protein M9458_053792 [Cirrhinus mrigala]|uniref:Uncharacterized protein n=1 Tax=Cirrhinus mrigala TaxID=683832 RepID=A0ABD0MRZ9_CIRMR
MKYVPVRLEVKVTFQAKKKRQKQTAAVKTQALPSRRTSLRTRCVQISLSSAVSQLSESEAQTCVLVEAGLARQRTLEDTRT